MKKKVVLTLKSILTCLVPLMLAPLFLSGCVTLFGGPSYKEFSANLSSIEPNKGRLVFYGTNTKWHGFLTGGKWKAKIKINGENIDTPHGEDIFFIVDRPAGENNIIVNGEDIYGLIIERGNTYFYEMQIYKKQVIGFTLRQFDFFLRLLKVDPVNADQAIKAMTYKAVIETN